VDRAAKQALVTTLHGVFKDTGVLVVAHNNGMVAAQSADFRRKVKEAGGSVKVTKNKLAQLVLKDTNSEQLSNLMKGPVILAYSKDPVAAPKVCAAFAKAHDKLVILGGAMGATPLNAEGVKALATMPSLDELRAKLVGLINAPATKVAQLANAPAAKLARVFGAYANRDAA